MNSLTIELPWVNAALSPNARCHWRDKHKATVSAKNYAWGMTKSLMPALGIAAGSWDGPVAVLVTFHPAIDRGRDLDNMLASCKAWLDGISKALGIDDKHFRPVPAMGEKRKPACVIVTLTPAAVKLPVRGVIK